MNLADHSANDNKQLQNNVKSPKKKSKNENVYWPEIMGINRDIYKRVRGKVRRK